jgi:hypothetical protein
MRITLVIYIIISCTISFAQEVTIDTLKLSNLENSTSHNLMFPIISSKNQKVDSLINNDILSTITNSNNPEKSVNKNILNWAEDIITSTYFIVTYNTNYILSIEIESEGCGAYCSTSNTYLNYYTNTGIRITLDDIIDTTSNFKTLYLQDKQRIYDQNKNELTLMLKEDEIDKSTFEWAIEYLDKWHNSIELNNFKLYNNRLVIKDDCYFPHAIQALAPYVKLEYQFEDIKEMMLLKIKP